MVKKTLKILLIFFVTLFSILVIIVGLLFAGVRPPIPDLPVVEESKYSDNTPVKIDSNFYRLDNNWIRKNRYGLWEMYVEGDAFDRGVAAGKLSGDLIKQQEEIFVSQIKNILPSKLHQRFLLTTVAWLNRKLTEKIPQEFLKEIYGLSLSASRKYDEFGPPYVRLLNYHAAHDIGHAMQSYYLVGCSSFAAWNENTPDSSLIIGRNFDFYFGEEFAQNKIIEFVSPDSGYNFAFITWGGMIGVVSGMNDQGLTVTINAGTMEISQQSSTPVTLVAREILQYSDNLETAIQIARSRKIMVAESFLISSAKDHKAIILEKKPGSTDIVWPDSSLIVCTNHFQGDKFSISEANIENRKNNATGYRYLRLNELINNQNILDPVSVVKILRDKNGIHDQPIGLGNEKAINQLLAHHSVIFEPEKLILWLSTSPNVMGTYVAYDLHKIFSKENVMVKNHFMDEPDLAIPVDSFIYSREYLNYMEYKSLSDTLRNAISNNREVSGSFLRHFQTLNPDYFETYLLLGDYYFSRKNYSKAKEFYNKTLQKEYNSISVSDYVEEQIAKCK